MNKTLLVVLIIAVLSVGGYFAWQYWPSCVKEGEQGSYTTQDMVCCEGLKQISNNAPFKTSETGCDTVSGTIFVCANCGNGECGLGENQCNCPADCGGQIIANILSASLYNDQAKDYQGIAVEFSGAVDGTTITNDTVKICVTSMSAGSSGEKSCFGSPNNIDPINGVNLFYQSWGNKWILNIQPFFLFDCAACSWSLEMKGLKNMNGNVLPNIIFDLNQYITPFQG